MTRINVKTAAKVIDVLSDALGGAKQFRKCYRVDNRQRVSNWRRFGQIPAVFRDAMKEDLEELGYEAPGALWGQYEHRKRPKKKPKPVTTSRQGNTKRWRKWSKRQTQKGTETANRNGRPN